MKRQNLRKLFLLLSFLLFPVTLYYLSPYLIIMGGLAGIITGSFLVFAALFLFSLFFGRAFCSWLCPAGGLQDCCRLAVDKKVSGKSNWIKYIIWVPWLAGILFAFIHAGGIASVDFFYMTEHGISAAGLPGLFTYFAITALITLLALITGRRGMCHTICWMAPFMIIGTKLSRALKFPALHLASEPAGCINCKKCTRYCPMSLEVHQMVQENSMKNTECILCGECADGCPKKIIQLTFKG